MDMKTQKMLADVIVNAKKDEVKPYTTKATVRSVNGTTIYVDIPGSDNSTPVKASSVAVKAGDVVDIYVSHNDTHITGNRSDVAVSRSTTDKMSKDAEQSKLEMYNDLEIIGNKMRIMNNDITMQGNQIDIQNTTITQMNDTIYSQGNTITQQGNKITEIGNTVDSQNNTITQQGNKITEMNSTIETLDSTVQTQGSKVTTLESTVQTQGSDIETINSNIETLNSTIETQGSTIETLNSTVQTQASKVSTLESTVQTQGSTIETLNSTVQTQGSTIETLNSTVETQGSSIETLNSTVQTQGSSIEALDSSMKIVNSAFVIQNGKLTGISEILTNILDSDYVTTDLLNADVAWIENGKIKQGAIGTVEIADAAITTQKVKDLSADVIKTGTLKTECLILTTDEVDPETGEKKVALITALNAKTKAGEGDVLDGAIIKDETIEAAKIKVVDLEAFGATIGNFEIETSNIHNGKTSLTDPTNGVYIGTDGIALGQGSLLNMTDDSPFRVESDGDFHLGGKDSNYINFDSFNGELNIDAKSIKMGSSSIATTKNVSDAKDAAISAAASDATAKANQAKSDAISAAASDATIKANQAKTDAISAVNETLKNYATLEVTNNKISSAVTETKAYTDAIRIGGRNLILHSDKWTSSGTGATGITPSRENDMLKVVVTSGNGYWHRFFTDDVIEANLNDGDSFTFSIEIKSDDGTVPPDIYFKSGLGYFRMKGTVSSDFSWVSYTGTWKKANDIAFHFGWSVRVGTYYIRKIKFEKGNKATDWTPAPEDVNEASVTEAKSYVDQTAESITATVQGVDGRLSKMEQNASGFTWTIDETAIVSTVNEYYKSTSATSLSGGSWSTSQPTWSEGTYIWMRTKNTNGKGTVSYTTAVCITGNTGATGAKGDTGSPGKDGTDGKDGAKGDGLDVKDTRNDNQPPSWYITNYPQTTAMEFKVCSKIGLSGVGTYCALQTIVPWNDASGGYPKQTAKVEGTGKEYWRVGTSASAWSSWVDPYGTAVNSAKTATNYMNFANNGLTIGNMTASTLGKNVLIDSDSVDIRNGTNVLASYGEEIVLRHDGEDAFTIKQSTLISQIKSAGRYLESSTEGETTNYIVGWFDDKTLTKGLTYIWHIKKNDRYMIFKPDSTIVMTALYYYPNQPAYIQVDTSSSTSYIPCAYTDSDAVSELKIDGSVWIDNLSDASGKVQSIPPLGIGSPNSAHLEIDNNEITAKSDATTPSILNLNMEGGAITFNNNDARGLKYQNGILYSRYAPAMNSNAIPVYSSWYEALNIFGDSNFSNIRLGYGTYSRSQGSTQIYGNNIELMSKNDVTSNTNVILSNGKGVQGTRTNGAKVNNFQPCNTNNNCVIGYGSYESDDDTNIYGGNINFTSNHDIHISGNNLVFDNTYGLIGKNTSGQKRRNIQLVNGNNNFVLGYDSYNYGEGATNVYGYKISTTARMGIVLNTEFGGITSNRTLTKLWSGADYMKDIQTASLSDKVTNQLNGIVLSWSHYTGSAVANYNWNHVFIPKGFVAAHGGNGTAMVLHGGTLGYKYLYISDQSIAGAAINDDASVSVSGITMVPKNYVLRYVWGV